MKAQWKQPTRIGLAEKLKKVTEKLREVLPQVAEAQAKAVEGMARAAILASQQNEEESDA